MGCPCYWRNNDDDRQIRNESEEQKQRKSRRKRLIWIVSLFILALFVIVYFFGGFFVGFKKHNISGGAAFTITGIVLIFYFLISFFTGYKENWVEYNKYYRKNNNTNDEIKKKSVTCDDEQNSGKFSSESNPILRINANNKDGNDKDNRARYKCLFVISIFFIFLAVFSLASAITYLAYGIKRGQKFDVNSYFIAMMGWLMTSKWCFACGIRLLIWVKRAKKIDCEDIKKRTLC